MLFLNMHAIAMIFVLIWLLLIEDVYYKVVEPMEAEGHENNHIDMLASKV